MDLNMVFSYDYISQNIRRRQTNVPPSRAISMAMAVRRCGTERIAQCSMTRASPEATERRHWAMRSVSHRRTAMAIEMARNGGTFVRRRRLF